MKKLILFILLSCVLVSCAEVSEAPLQTQIQYIPTHDFTYKYELFDVIIKEHDYIFFRAKNTDLRHLIHNPDCRKCQQDNEEDLFSWQYLKIMALKKQFKEIDCSLLDAIELRDKLDDTILEILSKNSKTEIKVTTDKITLYYYVEDE